MTTEHNTEYGYMSTQHNTENGQMSREHNTDKWSYEHIAQHRTRPNEHRAQHVKKGPNENSVEQHKKTKIKIKTHMSCWRCVYRDHVQKKRKKKNENDNFCYLMGEITSSNDMPYH